MCNTRRRCAVHEGPLEVDVCVVHAGTCSLCWHVLARVRRNRRRGTGTGWPPHQLSSCCCCRRWRWYGSWEWTGGSSGPHAAIIQLPGLFSSRLHLHTTSTHPCHRSCAPTAAWHMCLRGSFHMCLRGSFFCGFTR